MSGFFQDLQADLGILQAAGIDPGKAYRERKGKSPPEPAYRALVGWIEHAQRQVRLAKCNINTPASTNLETLRG